MKSLLKLVLLTSVAWLGHLPSGFGQTADSQDVDKRRSLSHFPIPFDQREFNQIRERLRLRQQEPDQRDKLSEDEKSAAARLFQHPEDPDAQKKLKELAQNPLVKDWLQQELNSRKDQLSPEQFNKLDESVKKLGEPTTNQGPGDIPNGGLPGRVKGDGPAERISGPKADEGSGSSQHLIGQQPGMPTTPSPEQSTPEQSLRRWIVDNFNPKTGPLAQSPAFQDALRELRRTSINTEPPAADDTSWAGRFARWSESLTKNDNWPKVDWPTMNKWRLPSSRSLPKIHSPVGTPPSVGAMPDLSLPTATALSRGLQVLWVVLILVAGILLWKVLGGSMPGAARHGKRSWKLGPWPVPPGAVASRQDVIRAFEYLSLLRLGPAARSRNHLELAAELGHTASQHRQSADLLAAVYEQARYTPGDELLSADVLTAARNELCFLAGVKHA